MKKNNLHKINMANTAELEIELRLLWFLFLSLGLRAESRDLYLLGFQSLGLILKYMPLLILISLSCLI